MFTINKEGFGVNQRVKKLIQFVARLEGFELPTPDPKSGALSS